ncbi:MAG: hypothetical protein ACE5JB_00555 [bacterium]
MAKLEQHPKEQQNSKDNLKNEIKKLNLKQLEGIATLLLTQFPDNM